MRRLFAALLLLSFAGSAMAQGGLEKTHSIEGVTEHRLANGLRVLTVPDPVADTITVHVTYLVARGTRATARKAWRTCSSTCCSRARSATRT